LKVLQLGRFGEEESHLRAGRLVVALALDLLDDYRP
jgi:hypothetical protein